MAASWSEPLPDAGAPRRALLLLLAGGAFALGWLLFAQWLFPALLADAYRGEGPALLQRAMSGRGELPLTEYLAHWQILSTRVLFWTAGLVGFGALWVARGHSLAAHWFAPARLRDLALARIAIAGMQTFCLLAAFSFSPAYQASLAAAEPSFYDPMYALRLALLPLNGGARPDAELLRAVWLAAVGAGACATLGLLTRPALLVLAWASTLLTAHAYSYGEFHHPEAVQTLALWALALAPSGAALSADAWLGRRWSGAPAPDPDASSALARWPLRLVQWLLALTYFAAGVAKLMNGGLAWFQGSTLAYYFAHDGLRDGFPLGVWLAEHPALLPPFALGTVLFELGFPLVLVLPQWTPAFAASALALHIGVYVVHGPPFFQHLALLTAFAEPVRRALRAGRARAALSVVYDGHCRLCLRSRRALEALDPGRRLAFFDLESQWAELAPRLPGVTQQQARHAMHVLDADGRIHVGFFAFRRIARSLPLLWPLLPLLWLPPLSWLGPSAYAAIAGRRSRVACASGACALPRPTPGPEPEPSAD